MRSLLTLSEIRGAIKAPPSKSVAQRAIAIAALTCGVSEISNAGNSEDVQAVIRVCESLGAIIQNVNDKLIISGGIKLPEKYLNCGESGLCIRMFAPIAATLSGKTMLSGYGTLKNRPMTMLEKPLKLLGVKCQTQYDRIPITVSGPFKKERTVIECSQSSQVLTGIIIAAPVSGRAMSISVKDLKSKPYIDLTIKIMSCFGVSVKNYSYMKFIVDKTEKYRPAKFNVEGDWSGAAFMLVAGAIGGEITVENLNLQSKQADIAVLKALKRAGATVIAGANSVKVLKNELKSFEFDVTDCPDLFPPLIALAVYCNGSTKISGISRLKNKESDRVSVLCREFSKLGIEMQASENHLIIKGSQPAGGVVKSHSDHRVAMALAVAALKASGTICINGDEAVNKSYPSFFQDLESITGGHAIKYGNY